jgi:hypothetical protein
MWKDHGTKVIGAVGTAASILAAADPTQVAVLLGNRAPFYVTAALSILTILRGFQNTANQQK